MKKNISILLIVMGLALQVYVSGVNAKIAGFYSKVGIPPTGLSTDEIRQAKDIEDTSVKLLNGKIITNDESKDLLGFYSMAGIQPSVLTIEMNRKAEFSSSLTPLLDKLKKQEDYFNAR